MKTPNAKSDVKAKTAYSEHLGRCGYTNVKIVSQPSDIVAEKDGQVFFFEVKMTKQESNYFGAATLTEWIQAIKSPDNFKFVIAKTDNSENNFEFFEYSPDQFMQFSTIPPFKIFFNLDLKSGASNRKRRSAIPLSHKSLQLLADLFEKLKD